MGNYGDLTRSDQMDSENKTQGLPFASDDECVEIRKHLIEIGRITPTVKDITPAKRTEELETIRSMRRRNASEIPDEGTYRVRRIRSDSEYTIRKRNYLVMLQSVLRSREELGLQFDDRDEAEHIDV